MAKRQRAGVLVTKKMGNWEGTLRMLKNLGYDVTDAYRKSQTDFAKSLRDRVIQHIKAQDLHWASLSPLTKLRKNQKNRNKIYVDTETYLKSIMILKDGNNISVGLKRGQPYKGRKDRSVTVDQVAMWMEFGTSKAPARPLWQPSIEEMGGAKGFRDKIASDIYERVKRISRGTGMTVSYNDIRGSVK